MHLALVSNIKISRSVRYQSGFIGARYFRPAKEHIKTTSSQGRTRPLPNKQSGKSANKEARNKTASHMLQAAEGNGKGSRTLPEYKSLQKSSHTQALARPKEKRQTHTHSQG